MAAFAISSWNRCTARGAGSFRRQTEVSGDDDKHHGWWLVAGVALTVVVLGYIAMSVL